MKQIIIILIALIFSMNVIAKEVSSLEERNGIKYEVNSDIPFTGKLIVRHANGKKESETNYINGKKHGYAPSWDEDGKKKEERNYINGKLEILRTSFFRLGKDNKKDEIYPYLYKRYRKYYREFMR